jgi:hypothetical protein
MMKHWIAVSCLVTLAGPACAGEPHAVANEQPSGELPRARDGNIAIAQELDSARKADTVEAYDLFIARHPDHPLAEAARREREALLRRQRAPDRS